MRVRLRHHLRLHHLHHLHHLLRLLRLLPPPPKDSKKWLKWVIIAFVAVLLIAGGIVAAVLLSDGDPPKPDNPTESTSEHETKKPKPDPEPEPEPDDEEYIEIPDLADFASGKVTEIKVEDNEDDIFITVYYELEYENSEFIIGEYTELLEDYSFIVNDRKYNYGGSEDHIWWGMEYTGDDGDPEEFSFRFEDGEIYKGNNITLDIYTYDDSRIVELTYSRGFELTDTDETTSYSTKKLYLPDVSATTGIELTEFEESTQLGNEVLKGYAYQISSEEELEIFSDNYLEILENAYPLYEIDYTEFSNGSTDYKFIWYGYSGTRNIKEHSLTANNGEEINDFVFLLAPLYNHDTGETGVVIYVGDDVEMVDNFERVS